MFRMTQEICFSPMRPEESYGSKEWIPFLSLPPYAVFGYYIKARTKKHDKMFYYNEVADNDFNSWTCKAQYI